MSKIAIQPKVSRDVYFKFKTFAQANGVPIEKAIEELMRQALTRAGIEVTGPERADKARKASTIG